MKRLALSDEILLTIEKPARYIGNEINSIQKMISAGVPNFKYKEPNKVCKATMASAAGRMYLI